MCFNGSFNIYSTEDNYRQFTTQLEPKHPAYACNLTRLLHSQTAKHCPPLIQISFKLTMRTSKVFFLSISPWWGQERNRHSSCHSMPSFDNYTKLPKSSLLLITNTRNYKNTAMLFLCVCFIFSFSYIYILLSLEGTFMETNKYTTVSAIRHWQSLFRYETRVKMLL